MDSSKGLLSVPARVRGVVAEVSPALQTVQDERECWSGKGAADGPDERST